MTTNLKALPRSVIMASNPDAPQRLNPFIGTTPADTFENIESVIELAQDLVFIERPSLGSSVPLRPRARDAMHTAFQAAKFALRWQLSNLGVGTDQEARNE